MGKHHLMVPVLLSEKKNTQTECSNSIFSSAIIIAAGGCSATKTAAQWMYKLRLPIMLDNTMEASILIFPYP